MVYLKLPYMNAQLKRTALAVIRHAGIENIRIYKSIIRGNTSYICLMQSFRSVNPGPLTSVQLTFNCKKRHF